MKKTIKKEMKKKDYIFLTMNNFTKEGGGTIRMYSIVNSLAIKGHQVILFSNAQDLSKFHKSIKHIYIDYSFMPKDKRKFQFLLSKFSYKIVNVFFSKLKNHFSSLLTPYKNKTIYTFEYLDNSMGFWLKKNNLIDGYINDIHGVSTLEFDFQIRNNKSKVKKLILKLKKNSACSLDRKVLTNSSKNIFVTESMRHYFHNLYPSLKNIKFVILNNLVPPTAKANHLTKNDAKNIRTQYQIPTDHKVILFTGAYKPTGGVIDLIKAFELTQRENKKITLLLVGDGVEKNNCLQYVKEHKLQQIIFANRIPYKLLPYYQALSDIIVCPDTWNDYSKVVIHIKYIDALLSNKLVINGSFPSVLEMNKNEELSLVFEPSNIESLSSKLNYALENYDELKKRYSDVSHKMLTQYTYTNKVNQL